MTAALGLDDLTPKSPRMPGRLFLMVALTFGTIYLSSSFGSPLSLFLIQAKWIPLGMLGLTTLYLLYRRPSPAFPLTMAVPLIALFMVAALNSWTSPNIGFSLLSMVTVGGTIMVGYFTSKLIVATDSRRHFFELLANLCRIMVVVTALFVIAGMNLGRGSGLSAWAENPNTLGMMLAPGMVIFLAGCIERRPGWPFWHAFFFIIGFYLIWATNSRASVIWIGMGLAAFWLYRRGPGFSVVLVMAALIVGIGWWYPIKQAAIGILGLEWNPRDYGISPLSGREEVWRVGWNLFWERPILGYGLGTSMDLIRTESYRFIRHQGLHFHSSYIMTMVELGLAGLVALLSALVLTLGQALGHAGRTRVLPRENWPLTALPFAMVVGGMGHAMFESWLIAAGNVNMLLFWTCVWMIHHQSQVKIRALLRREEAAPMHPNVYQPAR